MKVLLKSKKKKKSELSFVQNVKQCMCPALGYFFFSMDLHCYIWLEQCFCDQT